VAVDLDRLAGRDPRHEERHHRRVLRERALPRPEDVEVAQHHRLERVVDAAEADAVALGGELRDPVGGDRVGRLVLAGRQVPARAVDGGGGGEDDAADALVPRREQDVERALHVDGARGERVLDGARHGAERAEVVDDLDAAHRVVDALVAAQLALDDLYVEPLEVRAVAGREVVEHAHLVAALEQGAHEVRAEEAGPAGDEHPLRHQGRILPDEPAATPPTASHVVASSGTPATIWSAVQRPSASTNQNVPSAAANAAPDGAYRATRMPTTSTVPIQASRSAKPTMPRSLSTWTYSIWTPYSRPGPGNAFAATCGNLR